MSGICCPPKRDKGQIAVSGGSLTVSQRTFFLDPMPALSRQTNIVQLDRQKRQQ